MVLMGIPEKRQNSVESGGNKITSFYPAILPSALTTSVPITPLWDSIRFRVSSTSAFEGTMKIKTMKLVYVTYYDGSTKGFLKF